jgi:DNA-binding NarL/FixJ family response regulator
MKPIRVLLVDDHAILREGLRALLALAGDIEVVGEAGDGREAVDAAQRLKPDVILMDVAMPVMDGLEATLEIRRELPQCKVLILTQHDNKEYIFPILRAGAAGYVLKKAAGSELVSAIHAVYEGGAFLHPSVARAVVEGYVGRNGEHGEHEGLEKLSEREIQVLKLVAEGHSNQEIADMLFLSVKTVMGHRANVMQKLGLHNRTELVKYAIRQGLVRVDN